MATDSFLVFTKPATAVGLTIAPQGETTDQTFGPLKAIELKRVAFGAENPTTIGSLSGGAGAGKVKFQSIAITKAVDKASSDLFTACASGAHFPQVDLYIRRAGAASAVRGGGTGNSYLVYTFRMVYVTTISWSDSTGDDAPGEDVEMVYGALGLTYYMQNPDGTLTMQPATAQWSQVMNTPTLNVGP